MLKTLTIRKKSSLGRAGGGEAKTQHVHAGRPVQEKKEVQYFTRKSIFSAESKEIGIQVSELSRERGVLWLFQVKNPYAILHGKLKLNLALYFCCSHTVYF
jgi:hypothetical protein